MTVWMAWLGGAALLGGIVNAWDALAAVIIGTGLLVVTVSIIVAVLRGRVRRGPRGGRPVTYDTDRYRGRNVVERAFYLLKQWRGLATRYDCEDLRAPSWAMI